MIQAILAALLTVAAHAAAPAFDQGVDVKAVLRQAAEAPAPAKVMPAWDQHKYWLEGCKDVAMAPGVSASERFTLHSTEIVESCDFDPRGGMRCRPGFGMTRSRSTQLRLAGRPADAPAETFKVCLNGPELYVAIIPGPTRYDVSVGAEAITLTAK